MAAYASVVSLLHVIEKIQEHHDSHIKSIWMNPLIESLRDRACFLQDFLEIYYHSLTRVRDEDISTEVLESRIADAACAAEDILESHIVDGLSRSLYSSIDCSHKDNNTSMEDRGGFESQTFEDLIKIHVLDHILDGGSSRNHEEHSSVRDFDLNLENVIKDIDLIVEEVKKIRETTASKDMGQQGNSIRPSSSASQPKTAKNAMHMVGFEEYLNQVMERLTGKGLDRQVIPIFGMGGIGKTTLAKNIHVSPLIMQHFDLSAWRTISQQYSLRETLLGLLSEIGVSTEETRENKLGEKLHKELYGRRYLIILDDIWSVEAWDKVKSYFPDSNNGSRVLITTRISNLASHFGSSGLHIDLLDDDRSWNLFRQKVLGDDESLDIELVELGKMIAKKCKGLPLSIVTIAGLLAKSEKTVQYWEYVLSNLNSIVTLDDNEHCFKILSLSYSHLPVHLKPCFLYMGIFPEDDKICVSNLVKLWVSEGFLKPNKAKSLEEVANNCLKDLIDRNLILVHGWTSRGKIKTCYIHDLLRDLCLRECKKDKFLCLTSETHNIESQRRLSIQPSRAKSVVHDEDFLHSLKSAPLVRSFIAYDRDLSLARLPYKLLRVCSDRRLRSRHEMFLHFNSRYIEFELVGPLKLPYSLNLLWNLETLIINGANPYAPIILPVEIWGMQQLRHLMISESAILPDPPKSHTDNHDDNVVMMNLQTILTVMNFNITEEVIRRIPNVTKLKIECLSDHQEKEERPQCCFENLDRVEKLESLFLSFYTCPHSPWDNWQQMSFPNSLKKLILTDSWLPWESMTIIGSLPLLQVLKLWSSAFWGTEWNPVEGEFLSLKFLEIDNCRLKYLNADETCFPCLEHLLVKNMTVLMEVPLDIGYIPTLQSISVDECSHGVFSSLLEILEQQRSSGNESFQVFTTDGPLSLDE